ncbi:MAG: hypothetical protein ACN6O6_10910 [Pseudomonas sp.]|uniref:hypothetical protein n=1 Tax=Pseudomonas sp. TaxID=306 RepID=UPI003D0F8626
MTDPTIEIELIHQHGRPAWKVHMGRRAVIFQDEQAARAFAAQLHMRLDWFQDQADDDEQQPPGA